MVTLMRFFGVDTIFGRTLQTFSPSFTKARVVFLVSFHFMGLKTILPIKIAMAMKTFYGGFYPGSIGRTSFVSSKTGRAVLSSKIMMGGVLVVIRLIAMATVIRTIFTRAGKLVKPS